MTKLQGEGILMPNRVSDKLRNPKNLWVSDLNEAASLLDEAERVVEEARTAIASLDEGALGMALPGFGIPGKDEYPIRDELLSNLDAFIARSKGDDA